MFKSISAYGKRFLAVVFSIAQGSATGLATLDNMRDQWGLAAGAGLGFLGFMIRSTTAYFFQGKAIQKEHQSQQQIQYYDSPELTPRWPLIEPPPSTRRKAVAPVFVLLDAGLNFSDHLFTWRQLSQLFFALTNEALWPIAVISFLIQQSFYMCNEGYEATAEIAAETPFYKPLFHWVSRDKKTLRKLFRQIGALHHTVFEFTPWFIAFPQIILFMSTYPLTAGLPIGAFLILLAILVNDQTNLFEGQHMEQHLAEEEQYVEPVTIPTWRATLVKHTIFLMSPFHGAITAAPNYIVPRPVSPVLGMTWGTMTFFAAAAGVYESEVKEAKEQLEEQSTRINGFELA